MQAGINPILTRIAAGVAGLLVIGLVIKLSFAALTPVLPSWVGPALEAGGDLLFHQLLPVLAPLMALVIVGLAVWLVTGRR